MINGVDKEQIFEVATKTGSEVVKEWDDEPEEGRTAEDWPYPNHYVKSRITGPMARAIRRQCNVPYFEHPEVFLTEITVSDGYSDYTQEDWTYIRIECAGHTFEFNSEGYRGNSFTKLLEWLENETVSK